MDLIVALVVGVLFTGACGLIHYTRQARHHIAAANNAAADSEPQAETRRCTQRGCTGIGLLWVRTEGEPRFRPVCWTCGQVGVVQGWWAEFSNSEPYDQELDDEDFKAWTQELKGDVA